MARQCRASRSIRVAAYAPALQRTSLTTLADPWGHRHGPKPPKIEPCSITQRVSTGHRVVDA
eukprot:1067981-Rhodomonas_salina.2